MKNSVPIGFCIGQALTFPSKRNEAQRQPRVFYFDSVYTMSWASADEPQKL
jgi:hypothetical protein